MSSAVSFGSSAEAFRRQPWHRRRPGAGFLPTSRGCRASGGFHSGPEADDKWRRAELSELYWNFHKGLRHNDIGEVIPNAYRDLLNALSEGTAAALEKKVMLGGGTKLVNCLAGLAFDLEGTDSHQLKIPPFPKLASPDLADQAVELYWMALCRDVPFIEYESNTPGGELVKAAAKELSSLQAFSGPRSGNLVT